MHLPKRKPAPGLFRGTFHPKQPDLPTPAQLFGQAKTQGTLTLLLPVPKPLTCPPDCSQPDRCLWVFPLLLSTSPNCQGQAGPGFGLGKREMCCLHPPCPMSCRGSCSLSPERAASWCPVPKVEPLSWYSKARMKGWTMKWRLHPPQLCQQVRLEPSFLQQPSSGMQGGMQGIPSSFPHPRSMGKMLPSLQAHAKHQGAGEGLSQYKKSTRLLTSTVPPVWDPHTGSRGPALAGRDAQCLCSPAMQR